MMIFHIWVVKTATSVNGRHNVFTIHIQHLNMDLNLFKREHCPLFAV